MTTPTNEAQARLAALAAAMADANVDAAEYLAQALAEEARQRKAVRGFGIEIRWNGVTQRAEARGSGR